MCLLNNAKYRPICYVVKHVSGKYAYLCIVILIEKEMMKMIVNKQSLRELAMLQYQADKYRLAGNGFMCQHLNSQIRKLQEKLMPVEGN